MVERQDYIDAAEAQGWHIETRNADDTGPGDRDDSESCDSAWAGAVTFGDWHEDTPALGQVYQWRDARGRQMPGTWLNGNPDEEFAPIDGTQYRIVTIATVPA